MNLAAPPPSNTPETAAEWRRRARRARDLAKSLIGDPAEERLLRLAEEYEQRARQMLQVTQVT